MAEQIIRCQAHHNGGAVQRELDKRPTPGQETLFAL
jgi:hypothetical protein